MNSVSAGLRGLFQPNELEALDKVRLVMQEEYDRGQLSKESGTVVGSADGEESSSGHSVSTSRSETGT